MPTESLSANARLLCDRYLKAQLSGNRREALHLIVDEGLSGGLTATELHKVIQEAQREIGRLWQADQITIAQEHMATAISQVALSHVYQHAQAPKSNGKKIVVACVEGELHDFPARLVADALDLSGFEVRYLGANVPIDGLLKLLADEKPDLLVLSATMTFHLPALRMAVERVREHTQGALPIAVGGGVCLWAEGLATELGADISGCDATQLVHNAQTLLKVQP